ncbi:MAG: LamG domain-containing protein [Planctomycetia bacterium]|nr:LamG domain-containing protein [Planctomycetia bacterium]
MKSFHKGHCGRKNGLKRFLMGLVLGMLVTAAANAEWELTHSYTFDNYDGTTVWNNLSGTYDATIRTVGSGSYTVDTDNGTLFLNGTSSTNGAYVQLPNNLFRNDQTSATFEVWATVNQLGNHGRIFDIGVDDQTNRLFLSNGSRTSGSSYAYLQKDSTSGTGNYQLETGKLYHFLVSKTYDTATASGTLSYYVNGTLVGTGASPSPLTDLNGSANYIGKSGWTADNYVNGTFCEFNIYEGAAGPITAKVRAMEGTGTAQTSTLVATAQKIDAVIASATGFWDGSVNGYDVRDVSGKGNNLWSGDRYHRNSLLKETGNSSALAGTLTSNGITFRDGKDGINGFDQTTTLPALYANLEDVTFSTRVKMDQFTTTGASLDEGKTLFFMRSHKGTDIVFGLGTTYGTTDSGLLTLWAESVAGGTDKYYLRQDTSEENYTLELYDAAHADDYFSLEKNVWYDVTGTFDSIGDMAGELSLYVFDPTSGVELASATLEVEFGKLFSGGTEFCSWNLPVMRTEHPTV